MNNVLYSIKIYNNFEMKCDDIFAYEQMFEKKTRLKNQYEMIIMSFCINDNLDMICKYLFLKTKMLFCYFFFLIKILSK